MSHLSVPRPFISIPINVTKTYTFHLFTFKLTKTFSIPTTQNRANIDLTRNNLLLNTENLYSRPIIYLRPADRKELYSKINEITGFIPFLMACELMFKQSELKPFIPNEGEYYNHKKNLEIAVQLLRRAAALEFPPANYLLGCFYMTGLTKLVEFNIGKGLEHIIKAAGQGHQLSKACIEQIESRSKQNTEPQPQTTQSDHNSMITTLLGTNLMLCNNFAELQLQYTNQLRRNQELVTKAASQGQQASFGCIEHIESDSKPKTEIQPQTTQNDYNSMITALLKTNQRIIDNFANLEQQYKNLLIENQYLEDLLSENQNLLSESLIPASDQTQDPGLRPTPEPVLEITPVALNLDYLDDLDDQYNFIDEKIEQTAKRQKMSEYITLDL